MSELTAQQLEDLLAKAHTVVVWTIQDTIRHDAAGAEHLRAARHEYLKARVDAYAEIRPLTHGDVGGCTCDPHQPDPQRCLYHYAAQLQPHNHLIPWNCPTYYDGCNCPRKIQAKPLTRRRDTTTAARDLLGPLLSDALRRFNLEQGKPLGRPWREEARHTLLYASQDAAGLRTALVRDNFTDVQLAVELQQIISQLAALRNSILPASEDKRS